MNPQLAVLYAPDDILRVVESRSASDIIGKFIRMTPHSAPPTKDGKFHGGNYEVTSIGREMNGLLEFVLKEKEIDIAKEDNLSLFALAPDLSGNQYVTIPQSEALSSKAMEKARLNSRIDEVVKDLMACGEQEQDRTLLEQEFLQVMKLYQALKKFDHAYFTSFKERHGLPYDDILQARFSMIFETGTELKKPYGRAAEDSILFRAVHNLAERSRQTANFQFSAGSSSYADKYTIMARLPKFTELNSLFVPEKAEEMNINEVKRHLGAIGEQNPHYDFIMRWIDLFPIEKQAPKEGYASMLVEELGLSVRAQNCLQTANVRSVSDLAQKTKAELASMRNMGRRTVEEIVRALFERGIKLKEK